MRKRMQSIRWQWRWQWQCFALLCLSFNNLHTLTHARIHRNLKIKICWRLDSLSSTFFSSSLLPFCFTAAPSFIFISFYFVIVTVAIIRVFYMRCALANRHLWSHSIFRLFGHHHCRLTLALFIVIYVERPITKLLKTTWIRWVLSLQFAYHHSALKTNKKRTRKENRTQQTPKCSTHTHTHIDTNGQIQFDFFVWFDNRKMDILFVYVCTIKHIAMCMKIISRWIRQDKIK